MNEDKDMVPWQRAFMQWVRIHRPDLAEEIRPMFEYSTGKALAMVGMLHMAFEAGRDFQRANPTAERIALVKKHDEYNWDWGKVPKYIQVHSDWLTQLKNTLDNNSSGDKSDADAAMRRVSAEIMIILNQARSQ